jgi:hypothetical protein
VDRSGIAMLRPLKVREAMRMMFLKYMVDTEQLFNVIILWSFSKL